MPLFTPEKLQMFSEPVLAILETIHNKTLRVKYKGTTWPAKLHDSNCQEQLLPGQYVVILGIQGTMTLLISIPRG